MSVLANFGNIYLRGMRDRSMRSETELAREIQLTDWSTEKQTCLTCPLEYKYRVIFNLYSSWALFVLYEVQLDNNIVHSQCNDKGKRSGRIKRNVLIPSQKRFA